MSDKRNRDPYAGRYLDREEDEQEDVNEQAPSTSESETSESTETTEAGEKPEKGRKSEQSSSQSKSKSSEMPETSKESKSSESSKTSKSEETEKSSTGGVRDRKNVNMYLPDELVEDLQLRYAELNLEYRRERGEDMPKNQVFYPAVIQAALGESTIRESIDAIEDK